MKYYSEKLGKVYNTEKECLEAEFKAKEEENRQKVLKEREEALAKEKKEKEMAERKAAAAEVDEARKAMVAAQKAYKEKLDAFIKRYHNYHFTTTNIDDIPTLFDNFFNIFNL